MEEITVHVPTFRASKDISIKADIVEEVSRIYGFDNITPTPMSVPITALKINHDRETEYKIKCLLAESFGLSEVQSYLWYDNKFNMEAGIGNLEGIKLLSPSAPELADIRQEIAPTLLKFANDNRKNFSEFGIFDIGSVAPIKEGKFTENKELGILIASKKETENDLFYKMKGIINKILNITKNAKVSYEILEDKKVWMNPVKTAKIICRGSEIGYITTLHPKIKNNIDKKLNIVISEINLFKLYRISYNEPVFSAVSKYPEVSFDLSLLVDTNKLYEEVKKDLDNFESPIIVETKFVDLYNGVGLPDQKKSMTFTFVWGAKDHTLTGEEVEKEKEKLLQYLISKGYTSRY